MAREILTASMDGWAKALEIYRPHESKKVSDLAVGKYIGMIAEHTEDRYGDLYLVITAEGEAPDGLPGDLNRLTVRPRVLETGHVIDLSAPASHESVFSALCAESCVAVAEDALRMLAKLLYVETSFRRASLGG